MDMVDILTLIWVNIMVNMSKHWSCMVTIFSVLGLLQKKIAIVQTTNIELSDY